jgi:acetyl esterase/lipase
LIVAAQCDPLHDDAAALATALANAGVDVRFDDHAGLTHSFFHMGGFIARAREVHAQTCTFLDEAWRLAAARAQDQPILRA